MKYLYLLILLSLSACATNKKLVLVKECMQHGSGYSICEKIKDLD